VYGYDYYDYDAYTQTGSNELIGAMGMAAVIMWIISLAVAVFQIISMWKVFKKAGKGGWECIIPIYGNIVLLEIADLPLWYIVLYFIPFANIYVAFKVAIELAHKFNKSTGFGIGLALIPVVFYAILAFDKESMYSSNAQTIQVNTTTQQTPNTDSKFCPSCGCKVDNSTAFCPNCGNKLT